MIDQRTADSDILSESQRPEDMDAKGATVLLVDDDLDALDLLDMVMRRAGFHVIRASDGQTAVVAAEKHWKDIEAIILDIMMPGKLDGYGVCDRLRDNFHTRVLPIIVLSAKNSPSDMARSYAAGAFQHITKPYDIQHLIAVVESMVRLRRLERNTLSSSEKYRVILDNSPLEMLLISPELKIMEMNATFRRHFPQARVGDPAFAIVYGKPAGEFAEHPITKALETGAVQTGILEAPYDGKTTYRKINAAPLMDKDGNVIAVVDITEDITAQRELEESLRLKVEQTARTLRRHASVLHRQDAMADHLMKKHRELEETKRKLAQKNKELEEAQAELERLSVTDELTNLHNRRYFNRTFEREVLRAKRYGHHLAVLMLDIDHFKQVNDTYLHTTGDLILKEVAQSLFDCLRETDIVARYGGEEFVAILPETNIETAIIIGGRLRQAVKELKTETPAGPLQVTISVGVAASRGRAIKGEKLLKRADAALYKAKQTGRDRVVARLPGSGRGLRGERLKKNTKKKDDG